MDSFNVAVNCGSFLLPWNAIMLALGILVAVVVTELVVKKRKLYKDLALDACIVGIPCGIIGGRLFSALSGKIAFSAFFDLSQTGMNLPGALLFAAIGIVIYARLKKLDRWEVLDAIMPGAFFGLAVGRWSDFFLCDGLGRLAGQGVLKFFPLVTFTKAYFADHKTVAYAVFFLDFLICATLGVTALLLLKKKLQTGKTAHVTAILYLFSEFILEWLRDGEARQIVFGEMRFNQLVLIGMLLILVILVFASQKTKKTEPEAAADTAAEPEPEETADPAAETEPKAAVNPAAEPEPTEPEQETPAEAESDETKETESQKA